MALKLTSIQDVFKQKVKDSIEVPTIWADRLGQKHTDTEGTRLETNMSTIPSGQTYQLEGLSDETEKILTIDGFVIQVGSHVTDFSGGIMSTADIPIPENFNIRNVFKNAKNLVSLRNTFIGNIVDALDIRYNLPEDIFWGCPKLEKCVGLFDNSYIKTVPENLFAKNPELKSVALCFNNAAVEEIPSGLFKNNSKLWNFYWTFFNSPIKSIPEGLFDSIKNRKNFSMGIPKTVFDSTFKACSHLTGIPVGLLTNITGDIEVDDMFALGSDEIIRIGRTDARTLRRLYFPKNLTAQEIKAAFN